MQKEPWNDIMTRRERILGWIYLPIHVILLPLLLGLLVYAFTGKEPDSMKMNLLYFGLGLLVIVVGMWQYLKLSPAHHLPTCVMPSVGIITSNLMRRKRPGKIICMFA